MSEATVCPHMLCIWQQVTPFEFEERFILPVQRHLQECRNLNIRFVMSKAVLAAIMEKCPWNLCQDPVWRGWITEWTTAVSAELERQSVSHVPETIDGIHGVCPLFPDQELWKRWCAFLEFWGEGIAFRERWIKGIAVSECNPHCQATATCGRFHLVPPTNWRAIRFPWLLRYDANLPVAGPFPFVPPEDWRNAALHGAQHGYLDRNGNEWCWDRLHNDHWDVQLRNGGYRNVSADGRIL